MYVCSNQWSHWLYRTCMYAVTSGHTDCTVHVCMQYEPVDELQLIQSKQWCNYVFTWRNYVGCTFFLYMYLNWFSVFIDCSPSSLDINNFTAKIRDRGHWQQHISTNLISMTTYTCQIAWGKKSKWITLPNFKMVSKRNAKWHSCQKCSASMPIFKSVTPKMLDLYVLGCQYQYKYCTQFKQNTPTILESCELKVISTVPAFQSVNNV